MKSKSVQQDAEPSLESSYIILLIPWRTSKNSTQSTDCVAALHKRSYRCGVVRCVKFGPRSGCLMMTADTQPGMVNSGCPGSKSKHNTSPNTGRLRLTRNRRKVDLPTPYPPHTTVHAASRQYGTFLNTQQ